MMRSLELLDLQRKEKGNFEHKDE